MPEMLQALILPLGFLAIFYFFAIRPQKKRQKQIETMRSELRVGDEIITIGGIKGRILVVKEDLITIEVGSAKIKLDLMKWSVGSVVGQEEIK